MIPIVARGIASLAGRMITKNPRLGKKIFDLLKRPKGITVYRGESVVHSSPISEVKKQMGSGVGRWFSDKPSLAMKFAGSPTLGWKPRYWKKMWEKGGPSGFGYRKGVVKRLRLSPKEAALARRLEAKYSNSSVLAPGHEYLIVPKHTLPRVETDAIRTAIANMRKFMGMYKSGGLAKILNV